MFAAVFGYQITTRKKKKKIKFRMKKKKLRKKHFAMKKNSNKVGIVSLLKLFPVSVICFRK